MRKDYMLSATVFIVSIYSAGVIAVPVSPVVTAAADIVFADTGTAKVSIVPVGQLVAGRAGNNTKVADVYASTTSGRAALRWTPGAGVVDPEGSGQRNELRVSGKREPVHTLSVAFATVSLSPSASDPDWFIAPSSTVATSVHVSSVQKTIFPDSYRLSVDAAVWSE